MGAVQRDQAALPDGVQTLVLLGPYEPGFWPEFTASPEYMDRAPDPMDRWSRRIIDALAQELGASAIYPFGTQPPHPFYTWALATGRIWSSPVQFLVHDTAGLWASFRGALGFSDRVDVPAAPAPPCTDCARPCATACPVGALTPQGYNVPACHAFLDSAAGQRCMTGGCAVRAACPVSRAFGRQSEQSAFHMRQFHP
ncbi:ferredoxin [Roseinatronobacter sp. HJB301]|uniref:Ferredoxin n=2 Tax=Roseinatronobacter alkalisoli TaxID=3028235 RepID=A0ABT5T918_9RHOB|nr:ferredoxin [Roseinatronobacter sp. HJB301]MDD7971621.1 ferredoxin [Roseinatronobacter sp. HJB301]